MKKKKRPFNPDSAVIFSMVSGVVTVLVTIGLVFLNFSLMIRGVETSLLLPVTPLAAYVAINFITLAYMVYKLRRKDG